MRSDQNGYYVHFVRRKLRLKYLMILFFFVFRSTAPDAKGNEGRCHPRNNLFLFSVKEAKGKTRFSNV